MTPTCNVIKDLLPLYVEKIASADTCLLVEKHIQSCSGCRNELNGMVKRLQLPPDTYIAPLKKLRSKLLVKKIQAVVFSVLLTLLFAILAVAYLTTPNYLPHSDDPVSISKNDSGTILATFSDEVTGYDINQYANENESGYVYHITTWNSLWSQYIVTSYAETAVLNPNHENVVSIYYYATDGSEDILIYGEDLHWGGGIITLPRLVLAYYRLIAFVMAVICGIILLAFDTNERARNAAMLVFMLPVSYLVGHFLTKGLSTSTYSPERDFLAILLVMFPIYCMFLLVISFWRKHKLKVPWT